MRVVFEVEKDAEAHIFGGYDASLWIFYYIRTKSTNESFHNLKVNNSLGM